MFFSPLPFSRIAARAARFSAFALLVPLALNLTACGISDGVNSFLPPGPATTAPPGDTVIYVAQTIADRIDAFRLGTDGLLPKDPFDTIVVANPRRLVVSRGVLYASLEDRVVSINLDTNGGMPNTPSSSTLPKDGSENLYLPVEIVVRPGLLYVAASGTQRVESYSLTASGDIEPSPTGVGQGEFPANYASLALHNGFLYSGARSTARIDSFLLNENGSVPVLAEPQDPQDNIPLPDDIVIRGDVLYITSSGDRSVRAYELNDNAFLPGDYSSRTASVEYYENIMLSGNQLYAAAYNAGRIDVFSIDADGMLPEEKQLFSTHGDPGAYPADMVLDEGVLYVAQGGLNRVDAYVLGSDGFPSDYPTSSTGPTDEETYPISLALYRLP